MNQMNYDPNLTLCGRMATHTVKLTFGVWNYRYEVTVKIGGNCTGLSVIESAVGQAYDQLLDCGDASFLAKREDGSTMRCEDEDDREEDWLKDMLIAAEIVSIEPATEA